MPPDDEGRPGKGGPVAIPDKVIDTNDSSIVELVDGLPPGRQLDFASSLDAQVGDALHEHPSLNGPMLDALAAAGVAIRAPCGAVKIPDRPPWPANAVVCPICRAVCRGEL